MNIYKCNKDITLNLMNRKKFFTKDEEVKENLYTKKYPKYFIKIGEIQKIDINLAIPTYIEKINIPIIINDVETIESSSSASSASSVDDIETLPNFKLDLEEVQIKEG